MKKNFTVHTTEDVPGLGMVGGFKVAGAACDIRNKNDLKRLDVALIVSETPATGAGVFTTNDVKAAPVLTDMAHLSRSEKIKAIVANSGNANACNGERGMADAMAMCKAVAELVGSKPEQVLVCSTGVIGVPLPWEPYETGVPAAVAALAPSAAGAHDAACAVMTTDTVPKEVSIAGEVPQVGGGTVSVRVGGFVKGSGMIQPNMATMLAVLATDAPLTAEAAREALRGAVGQSFNKVTVDSDTSTNDTCILLATGAAGGEKIDLSHPAFPAVAAAVRAACVELARKIAADGEGSTKLVTVTVTGAASEADADTVARAIANSPLVKTAIFGHDANWGRVAAAAGKCGVPFDQYAVDIDFLGVPVCRAGLTVPMDEEDMLHRFEAPEIPITVNLGMGEASTRVWTCDLTHDYVTINGDYRT